MKTVYIVRHAEALKKEKPIPDFERPLIKRGVKNTRDVARRMKKAGINADLLISSPANRAIETAHIVAKSLKYPVQKILLRELLYESTNHEDFLPLIRELSNKHRSVMIFGHDPTFSAFARYVAPEYTKTMPKAALLAVEFDVDTWEEVDPGGGRIAYYDFPMSASQRNKLEKRAKKELVGQLTDAISQVLVALAVNDGKKVKKLAKIAASSIAARFLSKSKINDLLWRQLLQRVSSENSSDNPIESTAKDEVAP